MKFLIRLTLVLFVIAWSAPAFAGQCEIQTGPGWMKGKADAAPLGQVLAQAAEKGGYAIYLDEKLEKIPVTFTIEEKLVPEKAVRRIVHPHSYAVVFSSETEDSASSILEVWVFRKGEQHTARYAVLTPGAETASSGMSRGAGAGTAKGLSEEGHTSGAGRSLKGKDMVRRDLQVTKSPFGTPVMKSGDRSKGPDYRPNAYEMRKSYLRYKQAKLQKERRMTEAAYRHTRQKHEQDKESYRSRRNQELRQSIKDMK